MVKAGIISLIVLICAMAGHAQTVSFNHLTTLQGLSDNKVECATTDQNGFLWVGTSNGLNRFDGYAVTSYYKQNEPALCDNRIAGIFCDSRNRIWVGTYHGVTMIDEQRRFHKIIFDQKTGTEYSCAVIIEAKSMGIILYTGNGHYRLDEKTGKWQFLKWSTDAQFNIGWRDNNRFDDDQYIQTGLDKLLILDYANQRKSFDFDLPFSISACRINKDEMLVAVFKGKLVRISISQKKILKEYPLTRSLNGKLTNTNIVRVRQAASGEIIITTGLGGLFIFDPVTEKFTQYVHDALNPGTLSDNSKVNIFCDEKGNVFVTGSTGLDYFNINKYSPGYISAFTGANNEIYDGPINCIEQDSKGRLWMGGKDCLVMYDPSSKHSAIYRYYYPILNIGERPLEIYCIGIDRRDRVWVGTSGGGLGVLNEANGQFIKFSADSLDGKKPGFISSLVFNIKQGNDDSLWIGCSQGLYIFNESTYKTDTLKPPIVVPKEMDKAVVGIFKDSKGNFWIGTWNNGIYCYNRRSGFREIKYAGNKKTTYVNAFAEDKDGKIYAAGSDGISSIDEEGKETIYTSGNGKEYKNCSGLLAGRDGRLWFNSNNRLTVFNTASKDFNSFDERIVQRTYGFPSGAVNTPDSFQYWAGGKGILFFDPDKLGSRKTILNPIVYAVTTPDSSYSFTSAAAIDLPHKNNTVNFSFTATDLYSGRELIYQYRLNSLDKDWINSAGSRQVRYNSLAPGKYSFQVRVSKDGANWSEPSNTITVYIHPALWQTWWFRVLAVLLIVGTTIYLFRRRLIVIREREKIKREYEKKIAEVEMSSLRAQMNPHFMFNSLNSINNFILKNDPENASGYLTKFSRLMRLILDNSRSEWVSLENELKALELYIELEALRFENRFAYNIEIANDVDKEATLVPPMIIQPYVENAIWHGLMHRKEPGSRLMIHVWQKNGMVNIAIEDNGIGREEAAKRQSKTALTRKSHGMKITAQRLDIVNKLYNANAKVVVTDMKDKDGNPSGTSVLLKLNYKKNDSRNSG